MDVRRGFKMSEIERRFRDRQREIIEREREHATVELRDGREFRVVHLPTVYRVRNNPKEERWSS